jgi:diguanylate cyclase (GGDEF)-like protein
VGQALVLIPEATLSLDLLHDAEDRFSFDAEAAQRVEADPVDPVEVLSADHTVQALGLARQVSYHWDIAADHITWSANTKAVLGFDPARVKTGRQFAGLMDGENFFSRYDTVLHSSHQDSGDGVPYEIEYQLKQDAQLGVTAPWIEDVGSWFAGSNGTPAQALGIMRVANERHKRDQQMNFLSNCDPLTGMMNRARMSVALDEAIEVAISDKQPCAFAIVAVNNLDVMNEAYGFEVSDEVIVALGNRLRQVMRMGDGIARYSGSKFGIILNSCKPDELNAALERFMRAVRDSVIETKLGPVWALLSIGAVSLPALGNTATSAIAHAEEALSEAFRLPGDGFVVFTSSDERQNIRLLNARCATEIVSCLRDGLFKLAFQPIFDAKTGEVVMHEALLRMADTTGALITAGHLVPIAERLGLIRLIDRAVLQLALQTLQTYADARLSINISATTVTDPRWNAQLLDMIEAAPEPASRLVVEITETAALDNLPTSHDFVSALRSLGCGVALDDFGAGYTSYRNLKELPLTKIKLDGSFCCNLAEGGENYTFVRSMVELAHAFDLKVVAEWVDTAEDAKILASHGVDYLQGNMLGEASIIAPWSSNQGASFQLEASSLAPVDNAHFEHVAPDIATPRDTAGDREKQTPVQPAEPIEDIVAIKPELQSNSAEMLDDAALDAEIAALEPEHHKNQEIEVSLVPLYETALLTEPVSEVEDEVTQHPEPDLEDHLDQLRAALSALNAAFGDTAAADPQRLAS